MLHLLRLPILFLPFPWSTLLQIGSSDRHNLPNEDWGSPKTTTVNFWKGELHEGYCYSMVFPRQGLYLLTSPYQAEIQQVQYCHHISMPRNAASVEFPPPLEQICKGHIKSCHIWSRTAMSTL